MTDDLKFHIEGIRAKFKEIFSGGVTYSSEGGKNVEKSNDILKGKMMLIKILIGVFVGMILIHFNWILFFILEPKILVKRI